MAESDATSRWDHTLQSPQMSASISFADAVATLQGMFEHVDRDVISSVLEATGAHGGRGGLAHPEPPTRLRKPPHSAQLLGACV